MQELSEEAGTFSRRDFLQMGLNAVAVTALAALSTPALSAAAGASLSGAAALPAHLPAGIRAIAFDAFPIFNPRPVFDLAAKLAGDKGPEFIETWRTRQFEYTWLRTSGGRYKDFWEVTRDALDFSAAKCGLSLSTADKEQLMQGYLHSRPGPMWYRR
jgi:2-haloacid dehalogenase